VTALPDSALSDPALLDPSPATSGLPLSGPSVFVPSVSANLAAHLAALADRRGWLRRPAFVEAYRIWTHGEVHDRAARAATVLAGRGVGAGDRVLMALPDGIMWVATFLAVARLGATAVLVNPGLTADDHRFMAEDSRAAPCVSGPGLQDHFDTVRWLGADQLSLHAFVVPSAPVAGGRAADERTLSADLIALARERLAAFKAPRTVRVVASLPRTQTGKLRRHVVRTGAW
jgi:fatty acid CoA ligase FadD22